MIIVSDSPFDSGSLADSNSFLDQSAESPSRSQPVRAVPEMSANLWRHTLAENSGDRAYRIATRIFFAVVAALGIGSMAFAAWQTCALMSGNDLQNAVAACLR
jgi:hypothetical protein